MYMMNATTNTETTMNAKVSSLVDVAMITAMRAAREWFAQHKEAKYDFATLGECLKANVKIRLPQALADAKAAIECNMGQVAQQTFFATMALAGIDAAKECCMPA
jgi:hypothetical protein